MHTLQQSNRPKAMLPSKREMATRVLRKWRILFVVFLLVIAAFLATGQFGAKYSSRMTILVRKERVDSLITASQNSTPDLLQTSVSDEELNSEVELLKGEDLLQQVVRDAGLMPRGNNSPIKAARVLRVLEKKLEIVAVPKTNVIDVEYESSDPVKAQRVLAVLGQLYLRKHQQLRGSNYEISFLDTQVRQRETALATAEAQLVAFTRKTGVVSASQERDQTVTQMQSMREAQMEAEAALSEATARGSRLNTENAATSPRIATLQRRSDNPQLLEQIKSTLLSLQLKRADLLAKYDPKYRLVQDVDKEIALTQTMLNEQTSAPVQDTSSDVNPVSLSLQGDVALSQADLHGLQAKALSLRRSTAELQRRAEKLEMQDVEQQALLRAAKTQEDQYQLYVDKREQARMAASLDRQGILNVVIANPPLVPVLPVHSPLAMLFAALFVSTVLGIGAASVTDMFDTTVRTPAEFEEVLCVPLLEDFGDEIYLERGAAWQ